MKTNAKNTKKSSPARDTSGSTHPPSERVAAARSTRIGKQYLNQFKPEHADMLLIYVACVIRYVPPPLLAKAMRAALKMAKREKTIDLISFQAMGVTLIQEYKKLYEPMWNELMVHLKPITQEQYEKIQGAEKTTPQGQEGVQNGRPTPE